MGEWTQKIIQNLRGKIAKEAESIGQDMVVDIRAYIDTPVVRSPSGFSVIERSPEFENPWLETGNLWRSQYYEVRPDLEVMELNVFNVARYARILNDGHGPTEISRGISAAPRPFNDFARERWFPQIPGRIRKAIVE